MSVLYPDNAATSWAKPSRLPTAITRAPLRAQRVMKGASFTVFRIPGVREISPNCGVALRFCCERREDARALLVARSVQFEAVHHYPENRGGHP